MKNKANRVTLLFILASILLAIASVFIIKVIPNSTDALFFHFFSYLIFIILSGLTFRYLITKNIKESLNLVKRQKAVNDEIKESKERYDIVAKATSDTVWDWNVSSNQITWNKGIQNVFGYEESDVEETSQWWFDRIHPEDSIKMSVKLYSFLEQKVEKWQDEYRFMCKNGTYKYILDRGFLVIDKNNSAVRMIGAMQDISGKKQEEERLKLLETVITNAKDAILITDAEISNQLAPNVIFANEAYTQMSGYEFSEIVNKSMLDTLQMDEGSPVFKELSDCLRKKQECEIETLSYRKNGEEYWVKFSMVPVFNKENEHTHWISIKRDITQEKKQEKEKEQLISELTQNNKDLRQFSYITSHNLRAPLSNLKGLLRLIEDIEIKDEELQIIIDGFSKSTKLLNETISDLGRVVIIRDNPSIEKSNINVSESIKNVLTQINSLVEKNNPDLQLDIKKSDIIFSNKAYLESILLNLLTNALKYHSKKRRLVVHIKLIRSEHTTELIFEDNGIGIDLKKYKDKLFGLYQRFHNYPGSKGLGLYLVRSQIESMGGSISLESEVDKGTRFTVIFKNSN
ncbi:PAS domain-containing protein [Flavobacterium antarcticum]|uniref:PAS domain-containing sensor histidine kinase n=1 Tax=Flavobacterium antarcticum TaxID=271155 RepID=UPI0003B5AAB4|nr:PAS domain-containing protein [Flavobacterium antarcticum]